MSQSDSDQKPMPWWQKALIGLSVIMAISALINCFKNWNFILIIVYILGAIFAQVVFTESIPWKWRKKIRTLFWFSFILLCWILSTLVFSFSDWRSPQATIFVRGSRTTITGPFFNLWPFGRVTPVDRQLSVTEPWTSGLTADSVEVRYQVHSQALLDTANIQDKALKIAKTNLRPAQLNNIYRECVIAEPNKLITSFSAAQLFGSLAVADSSAIPRQASITNLSLRLNWSEPSSNMDMLEALGYHHQGTDLIEIRRHLRN